MDDQTGVITNFWKQLNSPESNKNKVMKAFFLYVLGRKPETKEYVMLQKLINDFDYDLVFDALVALRYSNIELENYFGYLISICRNLLRESIKDNSNDFEKKRTEDMLSDLKSKLKDKK